MRVALRFAKPYRVWHARLRARLEAEGHQVALQSGAPRRGRMLALALRAERLVYGSRSLLFALEPEQPGVPDPRPDCVLDLEGAGANGANLTLLFDAKPGEAAMLKALFVGRAPDVSIVDGAGRSRASGRPAIERPDLLSQSIDHVLAAAIDLIVMAVRNGEASRPALMPEVEGMRVAGPLAFVARRFLGKVAGRLRRGRASDIHWQVAIRLLRTPDPGVAVTGAWPEAPFTAIEDDGTAYHADPFPFEHAGRRLVFIERYLYATRKGVIAMVEMDADGVASEPQVVLDGPGHLSYPFIFEAEGGLYMLPETSDARCLRLFRADPFPDRWVPDKILVDDIVAVDATPIFHEGLFWIFASLAGDGGSSWDRLSLFHAPSMLGPWTAHKANPILVDAGAARPAGAMWHEHGVLMRVAQDCRTGYGVGLRICRVDRLDRDGYAQTIVASLAAPGGACTAHTLNRSRTMEVIDFGRRAS